ncbi:MAG: ParA family protein [Sulfuricurvum sp.]
MAVDYKGMSEYFLKSERTLRRWEIEKPEKFELMLAEYEKSTTCQDGQTDTLPATVMAAVSLKGGVGKSTIASALANYLDDSVVILNLDLAQSASQVNSCTTIDYVDYIEEHSVDEMIESLAKEYKFVIIDTPGDPTQEVFDALRHATKLIIPMTVGKRTRQATESTLETFFGEATPLNGLYEVFFFLNAYTDKKKRDEAAVLFKEAYAAFKPSENIKIKPKLGALDASNAIATSEETGKSIFQLVQENKLAYGMAAKKLAALCSQIEEHFGLAEE